MQRLIRPIVYVLGFSVFSACTTTRSTPISDLQPSEEPLELVLTLTDGSRLRLQMAVVASENLRGVVSDEDSRRLPDYFASWQPGPSGLPLEDGDSVRRTAYSVIIPRSDVTEVNYRRTSVAGALILMLAVAGFIVFVSTYEPPFALSPNVSRERQ